MALPLPYLERYRETRADFIERRKGELEANPKAIRDALEELFCAREGQPRLQLLSQLCAVEVNKCDAHALLKLIHEATKVIFEDKAREEADERGFV